MAGPDHKFVRITNVRDDKYIEFDFSFEDPEIFVELILPVEMFQTFCEKNKVQFLEVDKNVSEEYEKQIWRLGQAGKKFLKNKRTL